MSRARPRATLDDALRARALTVLGAPASALECSTSASALAALAEFLEDTVIRALPADQRDGLRRARTADARGVRDALTAYGEHLEPAIEALGEGALDAVADELLERATALKHADASPSAARDDVEAIERSSKRLKLFSRDADEVSGALASDAGWEALTRLATALGAETNGTGGGRDSLDACVLLERCVVAQERFVTAFASASGRETARNPPKLEDMPSGVGLNGDAEVERAVAVARLLHVNDLRRLQSEVDAFLVAMQEYTADPKTDSRIGKVGR